MIIKVKYIALQWDNVQGGQGRPFENTILIEASQFEQLHKVYELANLAVINAVNSVQFNQAGEFGFKILSIELDKPVSASKVEFEYEDNRTD